MTSQPGQQTIIIHILPNISRSKSHQAMKIGQVTIRIFFFKNHAENEEARLVSRPLFFFKKALYEVKASGLQLSFNIRR